MNKLRVLRDAFEGTLLGVAVGDALGNPVEGYTREDIQKKYGFLKEYEENWDPPGNYTDDTELTLAITESLVEVGAFSRDDIARKFVRWLPSAGSFGMACQEACINLANGSSSLMSGVMSAGNGAAMRTAPIGLLHSRFDDQDLLRTCTIDASRITHVDERAVAGALAISASIAYNVNHQKNFLQEDYISSICDLTKDVSVDMTKKIYQLQDIVNMNVDDAVSYIGTSGFVMESVPFAIYCFLRSPRDFESSVTLAVNAGGDTDSNASMTGAISGALNGTRGIPSRWLEGLQNGKRGREYIIDISNKLFELYKFSSLPGETDYVALYDLEELLFYSLSKRDYCKASAVIGDVGALHVLTGDVETGIKRFEEGLAYPGISHKKKLLLKLALSKAYLVLGADDKSIATLCSVEPKNIYEKLAVDVMCTNKGLRYILPQESS